MDIDRDMPNCEAKRCAALKALDFVKSGMLMGLGTGSTAAYFIEALISQCQKGLKVSVVATSSNSEKLAKEGGLDLVDVNKVKSLDLVVDGADEVDKKKRLIKGAGGALLREKVIASMSEKMIVIADETKEVDTLGKKKLPIEILPFGVSATIDYLEEELNLQGHIRFDIEGSGPFVTDNGNWIIDLDLSEIQEFEQLDAELISHPGIIETGFFFDLASIVIIGRDDGQVDVYQ